MRNIYVILILLSIFLSIKTTFCQVDTFYVAPSGNDENSGTIDLPWKSVQKAASTLQAGQVAFIREGTYNEKLFMINSGIEGKPITIEAYPGETPIIDASGLDSYYIFDLNRQSHLRIAGIRFQNGTLGIGNAASHIVIENNEIANFSNPGISLPYCSFAIIKNNIVDNVCNSSWGECITMSQSEYIDIAFNEVKNSITSYMGGEGIDVVASKHVRVYGNKLHNLQRVAIYLDSYTGPNYDIEVFNNVTYNAGGGIIVSAELNNNNEEISIYNNLLYDIDRIGIGVVDWAFVPSSNGTLMRNIRIENNTLSSTNIHTNIVSSNAQFYNISIKNNILYNSTIDVFNNQPKNVFKQNNLSNIGEASSLGDGSIIDDPQFIDASNNDFRLLANSPAIGMAVPNNILFDYDFLERAVGSNNDIGAFEYGAVQRIELPLKSKPLFTEYKTIINNSANDACENTLNGEIDLYSDEIDISYTNDIEKNIAAYRFINVEIPQGARVINSYLRLYLSENIDNWFTYPVEIHLENSVNSPELTNTAFNISDRELMRNSVSWNVCSHNRWVGWTQTPSLDNMLNELISNLDWVSGNAITFIMSYSADYHSVFKTIDGNVEFAPELVVEYTLPTHDNLLLNPTSLFAVPGDTFQIESSKPDLIWQSIDTAVAKVNENGLVICKKGGWSVVTAKTQDGLSRAECIITVREPVTGMDITSTSETIYVGETKRLAVNVKPTNATNTNIVWESVDKDIVSVNSEGIVQGVNQGETVVAATSVDGRFVTTINITVLPLNIGVSDKPLNKSIDIYPNPTIDRIIINLEKIYSSVNLKVYNSNGLLIDNKVFQNINQLQYELLGETGLYILELNTGGGHKLHFKVLKK